MAVKKTKKLSGQTVVTTINGQQYFVMTDSNGKVTLVNLANLKNALLSNMSLNSLYDGVFIMYHRSSQNPCRCADTGDNEVDVEQRRSERRRYDDVGQSDGIERLERQDEHTEANRSLKGGSSHQHCKLCPRLL